MRRRQRAAGVAATLLVAGLAATWLLQGSGDETWGPPAKEAGGSMDRRLDPSGGGGEAAIPPAGPGHRGNGRPAEPLTGIQDAGGPPFPTPDSPPRGPSTRVPIRSEEDTTRPDERDPVRPIVRAKVARRLEQLDGRSPADPTVDAVTDALLTVKEARRALSTLPRTRENADAIRRLVAEVARGVGRAEEAAGHRIDTLTSDDEETPGGITRPGDEVGDAPIELEPLPPPLPAQEPPGGPTAGTR